MSLWLISTRRHRPTVVSPVGGLAMSRGPTGSLWGPDCDPVTGEWGSKANQFAEAVDFTNAFGINIKPYYHGPTDYAPMADRVGELGIKHIRMGLFNPALHTSWPFHEQTQLWYDRAEARGVQTWGLVSPGEENRHRANEDDVVPSFTDAEEATWFRSLNRQPGLIGTQQRWTYGPWIGKIKYETGWFRSTGWERMGGLQCANEPDARQHFPEGVGGIREQIRQLKDYKESKTSEVILDGEDYVNFETGRLEDGPAYAPQLPAVGFHNLHSWGQMGDYTDRQDMDFGSPHVYYGGHDPIYERFWPATWGVAPPGTNHWYYDQWPYNGRLSPGGYWSRTIPLICTETGYITLASQDPGQLGPQRHCAPDVAGEYLIRTMVGNYCGGYKRIYLYKITHEGGETNPGSPAMGLCKTDFTRLECFYAIKNLIAHCGWVQGSAGVAPITVPHSWSGPGAPHLMDEGSGSTNVIQDRLWKLLLRRSDDEYLIILSRNRRIWNRFLQTRVTVPDPLNVTLTLPASDTWTCGVAEPAKNPVLDATDGQTYANPGNGMAYAAPGVSGNGFTQSGNTLTVRMAGLTRVVRIVRDTPLPPPPQTGLTPAIVAP